MFLEDYKIAQISDLHLSAHQDKNAEHLRSVIHYINTSVQPQHVIVSGDLVDYDRSIEAYYFVRQQLDTLQAPYAVIPGNHDDCQALAIVFQDKFSFKDSRATLDSVLNDMQSPLALIMLDSVITGETKGGCSPKQIHWLEEVCQSTDKPILIFIHHPPLSFSTLDAHLRQSIEAFNPALGEALEFLGAEHLAEMVQRYPTIKGLFCGHLHCAVQFLWQGKHFAVAPSIAPPHREFMFQRETLAKLGIQVCEDPGLAIHTWNAQTESIKSDFVFCPL